ncbi:MAG TPA: MlaD family protein [Kofleriaceae bacterium]|nr:MlaD family protein [Kofleriaceae bacterium]
MKSTSRHVKLGLLALLAAAAVVSAMLALGLRKKPTDVYHTYFNESVQGLDEGAIVKFRGVRIGKVKSISVAPDRRLIDVGMAIDRSRAAELRLDKSALTLRARLVIFGITGVKLIDLDFADEHTPPAPELTFKPPARYIPSEMSLLGSLEDDVVTFAHRLPMIADHAIAALDAVHHVTYDARSLLEETRDTVTAIGYVARGAARADLPKSIAKTLGTINGTLDELGQRTTDATGELESTIRDIGDAARQLRDFLDTLEREPDILIKGRYRPGRRR